MRRRTPAAGFTLTEILMAVGILGIGMSMVASIYPVAMDQSRRARDVTNAALAARSTAAMLRARRDTICRTLRAQLPDADEPDGPNAIGLDTKDSIYNPWAYLYESTANSYAAFDKWKPGNYTCRVYFTRIWEDEPGPYRATILVYKARGADPGAKLFSEKRVGPGAYALDADEDNRGEAYLVDYVEGTMMPKIFIGTGLTAGGDEYLDRDCISLPEAVAAFHTVLGD